MKRIAIVGGGISGLSAAYALQKYRAEVQYVLFESSARFGGVIRTEQLDGCTVEAGPDSFLTEKPWATQLCQELGLGDELIGSNDHDRKTYILLKGSLVQLPDGLMFMAPTKFLPAFLSPLFSWRTKFAMIREWFHRPVSGGDSTVAQFVERHYGREMVERVADPLLAGVYGGSADDLSVRSVLPRFAEMEAQQGSLGRAMLSSRRQRSSNHPAPLFTSLKNGMQQMIDALLATIPQFVRRPNTSVSAVRPDSGKWMVASGQRTEEFDAVVVATPAHVAAEMLAASCTDLAAELSAIEYSSSVTAVLGFDRETRAGLPPGFGFLVPRTEKRRLLAATFVHNKFSRRAPEDRPLIRCFLGGSRDGGVVQCSEDELQQIVRQELQEILGITSAPRFARIYKWKRAMAQYNIGHNERMRRIRALISNNPGLALAGNAYGGIGVPDCVRSGSEAAAKVLADLAIRAPAVASGAS